MNTVSFTAMSRRHHVLAALIAALLLAAGCSSTAESSTPGTAPGTTAGASDCTIDATAARGELVEGSVEHDGLTRTYLGLIPSGTDDVRLPLVIDLHGYAEGMGVHTVHTKLDATAEAEGFLYVSPDGTGDPRHWNDIAADEGADDLGFIEALIDEAVANRCADPTRVYVTGLSNGAFMASLVGCELADRVAAIGPVAGLTRTPDCDPARPIPVIAFHGGEDAFISIDGGFGPAAAELPNVEAQLDLDARDLPAIEDAGAAFAADDGCATGPTESSPVDGVRQLTWSDCDDGVEVVLYLTPASGHVWPGSEFEHSIAEVTGTPNDRIDANALLWAFFERFSLPAPPS